MPKSLEASQPKALATQSFDRAAWFNATKSVDGVPELLDKAMMRERFKRVGRLVVSKYGPNVFGGDLGRKVRKDLAKLQNGGEFRIVDADFLIEVRGVLNGFTIELTEAGGAPGMVVLFDRERLSNEIRLLQAF